MRSPSHLPDCPQAQQPHATRGKRPHRHQHKHKLHAELPHLGDHCGAAAALRRRPRRFCSPAQRGRRSAKAPRAGRGAGRRPAAAAAPGAAAEDQGVQSRCIMFASFKVAGRGSCRCQSNPLLSLVLACSSLFDLSDCHLHQRGQARSRCLLAPLHAGRTPTAHCILACVTVSSRSERLRACSCCCCCCYKHPMWTQVPGILTVYQSPALSKRFYWSVLTASRAASSM